ncbi:winged helix-turn-helix transcriptional regulator [Paenibacillus sp. GCM10012307]|uniref:Helix-turn-helix transcriptional regulator n=1 Tax=Paenibacillus roseus TaxID=2798579 RepID=A0A934MSU9_9BACL|nr:helix-turn-helix domain-containing protein [Paenibacillus roseus]MBJ6364313.1 helix-turn-helix transcriptional regulator [Paenibacillus roseus]
MDHKEFYRKTGVEVTLEVIGGKWKSIILYHLTTGKKRTSQLKKLTPNITQKMLTKQLRELECDGIISRTFYNQIPLKVEYELTEYGWSLKQLLDSVCEWGERHAVLCDKHRPVDTGVEGAGVDSEWIK